MCCPLSRALYPHLTPQGGLGDSTPLEACSSWQYDTSQFQNTIIENWDLVCANKIMSKVGSFTFFAGTGVGVFIAGCPLSSRASMWTTRAPG